MSDSLVLVAEDDDELRRLMVDVLNRDGYRVIAVADFAGMVVPLRQPLLPGAEPDRGAPEL